MQPASQRIQLVYHIDFRTDFLSTNHRSLILYRFYSTFISFIFNIMRLYHSEEFLRESNYIRPYILSLSLCIYVLFFILSAYIASFYNNENAVVFLKTVAIYHRTKADIC